MTREEFTRRALIGAALSFALASVAVAQQHSGGQGGKGGGGHTTGEDSHSHDTGDDHTHETGDETDAPDHSDHDSTDHADSDHEDGEHGGPKGKGGPGYRGGQGRYQTGAAGHGHTLEDQVFKRPPHG